jgi:putative acetyltransferase
MEIRRYQPEDVDAVCELYRETTRVINGRDYTPEQVAVWVAYGFETAAWAQRLADTRTFLACDGDRLLGFAELEKNGHLAFFYCHHAHQREGVGRALNAVLEQEARDLGLSTLRTEVSVSAYPFFTAVGYITVERQVNMVEGAPAARFLMEKAL